VKITEVRIKLMESGNDNEKLQAFCSITFDHAFVIRDLKIIEGTRGWFVAMPSRKLMDRCTKCICKNQLRARFCNQCGNKLAEFRGLGRDINGKQKMHADIAHPINAECRENIQRSVLNAFHAELEKSKLPGYVCNYEDIDHDYETATYAEEKSSETRGYQTEEPS